MSVQEQLQEVQREYEAMSTYDLIQALKGMGEDEAEVLAMTRDEMINPLMALEQYAAFH